MLHKTKGLVLGFTKFRETSIIVRVFTELFGLRAYIVNGVRSASAKNGRMALYQPLNLLDMLVYNKEKGIQRIAEASLAYPYADIGRNHLKNLVGLFLCEIFVKVMKEDHANRELFGFAEMSLPCFDRLETGVADFHLVFLTKMAALLGYEIPPYQMLQAEIPGLHLSERAMVAFTALNNANYGLELGLDRATRRELLDTLVRFYMIHFPGFSYPKSLDVLQGI